MNRIMNILPILIAISIGAVFAQPKLEIVGGDTQDWGNVKAKESPLKADVKLKNIGDEKLVISNVKPTCGCTTAPLDKNELAPGESATMSVSLSVGSRTGNVNKSVYIYSNDAYRSKQVLRLKANVSRSLEIQPKRYLTFNEMTVGLSQSASVNIKNNSNKTVTITDIKISPENMMINIDEGQKIKPGEAVKLEATVRPTKKGYFNCHVTLKTTDKDYPELKISGFGNIRKSAIFNNE